MKDLVSRNSEFSPLLLCDPFHVAYRDWGLENRCESAGVLATAIAVTNCPLSLTQELSCLPLEPMKLCQTNISLQVQ